MGIQTLFGELDAADSGFDEKIKIPEDEVDERTVLAWEKEMLGLYVSSHPLMGAEASLRRATDATIGELANQPRNDDGREPMISIGGVVTALQRKYTRNGDLMAVFTLEDLQDSIEVMVFPRTMAEHGYKLDEDAVVVLQGRADARDDEPKFIANQISRFEASSAGAGPPIHLTVPSNRINDHLVSELKGILSLHPGDSEVLLHLDQQVARLPDAYRVDPPSTAGQLRVLLGPDAVMF